MTIYLSSLGCVRNLVDSEVMVGSLVADGHAVTQDPSQADVIIINTCSFIKSAIDESIDLILELAEFKKTGKCKKLIVTGCLPERFQKEVQNSLPEVDHFLGTGAYHHILDAIKTDTNSNRCMLPSPGSGPLQQNNSNRIASTAPVVYLKIAEGCIRRCSYCIIPKLRGPLRSRQVPDIVAEASQLIASDFKEIILIGQDTFAFGTDLNPPEPFRRLLQQIAGLSEDVWIRFLYGSPDLTDNDLIQTVAENKNICSYFDIPVQHVAQKILKRMGRQYEENALIKLFENIRSRIPDAALRTTLMVGFPGETDRHFNQLKNFVKTVQFDHVGVFIYSDAEDLPSHRLSDHVPAEVAQSRYDELMAFQAQISFSHNKNKIHQIFPVLIEQKQDEKTFIGRTYFQAPEVDGITYVESQNLRIGDFANVAIKDASEYDLMGEVK